MKKMSFIISGLLIIFCSAISQAQTIIPDTIYKIDFTTILCEKLNISSSQVQYLKLGGTEWESISRKEVMKIVYKDGRKEPFNKGVFEMIDANDWKAVILTKNPKDVTGLDVKCSVSSESTKGMKSKKAAKRSAEVKLMKEAVKCGATIVLITRMEPIGGYGEVPSYIMEGKAYGLEMF